MDIFEKFRSHKGNIGQYIKQAHGYFAFPKLEGEIGPRMRFRGKEVLNWSLNNYIGLANHPEVRKVDAQASKDWGLAYPMGARMMSGQTTKHEQLERELAAFVKKPDAFLLNFGYQGMVSIIDTVCGRKRCDRLRQRSTRLYSRRTSPAYRQTFCLSTQQYGKPP
ncbi:MAG: hypothetical protein AB2L24_19570 [Mangrovibacterium sp.]